MGMIRHQTLSAALRHVIDSNMGKYFPLLSIPQVDARQGGISNVRPFQVTG